MRDEWDMLMKLLVYIIGLSLIGNSLGLMLGNMVVGGAKSITQFIPIFFVPFVLLAGFIINTGRL
jgi:hypothetical protein